MATSPLISPERGGLFATGSNDTQAKIWSYNIVVPQQPSRNGIPDIPQYNTLYIPNYNPGPQKFQPDERQATAGSQFSRFRLRKRYGPISQTQEQVLSTNVTSKPQNALSQYVLPPKNTNVIKKAGSSLQFQSQSQLPSSPDNVTWRTTQSAQLNSVLRVDSPPGQLESNNQHTGKETGTESVSSAPEADNKSWLMHLKWMRKFALICSRTLPQRLQKVYGAQGSLPRGEETIQAGQEKLDKMKNDIIATEALYDGLLQHISEEEKIDHVLLRERTLASKRERFEEDEEKLRVIRRDTVEVELLTELVKDLKRTLPELVKELQCLKAYVDTLPDV
jgi:hypothetical protein